MKKVLFLLVVLTAMVFTSCEKEDEAQLLSEFIVGGEWVYTQIEYNMTHVLEITFIGTFHADGTYDLTLTDGTNTMTFGGNYSINDDLNQLTLDEPDIEQDGETDVITFDVAWIEDVEQMVWTEIDDTENVLTWTR